ncbi:MAG TPA: sigma-70 family RNA polymerase sigma factor [Terriglobales bacterium]|nr:sigma-70 family RNA polymerase sigma factor [Terriglobales bacterium]
MSTQDTAVGFTAVASDARWGEQQLVAELRAGSVEAFNYLIAVYHQPLYRFVARIVTDAEDGADILQDIFLKVFRSAANFEGKSSLKTWLYQIALHEASNHRRWWRRHKRQETSMDEEDEHGLSWASRLPDGKESPLGQAMRRETQLRLRRAMAAVPEPFHAVLLLREIEGFSYDEIAEVTQVKVGTVKSRLLRGREMLRQALLRDRAAAENAGARSQLAWNAGSVSDV